MYLVLTNVLLFFQTLRQRSRLQAGLLSETLELCGTEHHVQIQHGSFCALHYFSLISRSADCSLVLVQQFTMFEIQLVKSTKARA